MAVFVVAGGDEEFGTGFHVASSSDAKDVANDLGTDDLGLVLYIIVRLANVCHGGRAFWNEIEDASGNNDDGIAFARAFPGGTPRTFPYDDLEHLATSNVDSPLGFLDDILHKIACALTSEESTLSLVHLDAVLADILTSRSFTSNDANAHPPVVTTSPSSCSTSSTSSSTSSTPTKKQRRSRRNRKKKNQYHYLPLV